MKRLKNKNSYLATLGTVLHDEADDTVARAADGEETQQLVAEGLALGHGARGAVLDALGEELDGVLGELETLLDHSGELADAATLVTEDILGAGSADDDLGADGSHADLFLFEQNENLTQLRFEIFRNI